ncbi:MAG: YbjN domain-containing protein [Clostridia bacterium]|nr:YbjN domain-containing protein [Clostridia bacterium]
MDDKMMKAKEIYETICSFLNGDDWKYERHDEDMVVTMSAKGEDLPISFVVRVDAERHLVVVYSQLPFEVSSGKMVETAVAVSMANFGLVDGSFDMDIQKGKILFRMTTSYLESLISESVFAYMIYCTAHTVDKYNDKLMMLAKGMIDLAKFKELTDGN